MRGILALATLLSLALSFTATRAADGPSSVEKPGPRLSGFHDFLKGTQSFTPGIGSHQSLSCTVSQASQPVPYAGNSLLDCDGETPHNETTLAVDPENPAHAIGGFHSYLLSFRGSTVA